MKVWGIKIWVITTTSFSRLIGLNRCTVPWSNLQERPTEFFSNLVLFKSVVKVKVVILMFFYRLKFSLGGTPSNSCVLSHIHPKCKQEDKNWCMYQTSNHTKIFWFLSFLFMKYSLKFNIPWLWILLRTLQNYPIFQKSNNNHIFTFSVLCWCKSTNQSKSDEIGKISGCM